MAEMRNDFEIAMTGRAFEGCEAVVRLFEENGRNGVFLVLRDKAKNCHVQRAAEEIWEGKIPEYLQMRARSASALSQ